MLAWARQLLGGAFLQHVKAGDAASAAASRLKRWIIFQLGKVVEERRDRDAVMALYMYELSNMISDCEDAQCH